MLLSGSVIYIEKSISISKRQREGAFLTLYCIMCDVRSENLNYETMTPDEVGKLIDTSQYKQLAYGKSWFSSDINFSRDLSLAFEAKALPVTMFTKDRIIVSLERGVYWEDSGVSISR